MNGNVHERAMDLLTLRDVEGISEMDARWLATHLESCADCAAFEEALSGAEQAVRSVTVMASAGLVQATRTKVRARAEQLHEQQARRFLIAISFAMGLVFSAASAWVWWKAASWMVERFSWPSAVLAPGLVAFWLLPGILLGVLLLARPESSLEGSFIQLVMKDRERGKQ